MNQDDEYLFVCGVREVGNNNSGPLWLGYFLSGSYKLLNS
jgi:hypothetical protein